MRSAIELAAAVATWDVKVFSPAWPARFDLKVSLEGNQMIQWVIDRECALYM